MRKGVILFIVFEKGVIFEKNTQKNKTLNWNKRHQPYHSSHEGRCS